MKKILLLSILCTTFLFSKGQDCQSDEYSPTNLDKTFRDQAFVRPSAADPSKFITVAVDIDYDMYVSFDQDTAKLYQYTFQLFEAVSNTFQNQFGIHLKVGNIHIFKTDDGFPAANRKDFFANYYRSNMGHIERNLVIHFSSEAGAEDAFIGGLCQTNNEYGVVMNATNNVSAYTSNTTMLDLAHVIGHLFGAAHSNNCFWGAPIDNCASPEGPCAQEPSNSSVNGNIMSFCSNRDMVFHPTIANYIGNFSSSCIQDISAISGTPNLKLPENVSVKANEVQSFFWDALDAAVQYQLQISTLSDFSVVEVDTTLNFNYFKSDALQHGSTYYWRVKGSNMFGEGSYSSTFNFTVRAIDVAAAPQIPTLLTPVNNTYTVNNPIMTWSSLPEATSYTVQFYNKENTLINETTTGATLLTIPDVIAENELTIWRVRANNANGSSSYSVPNGFIKTFGITLDAPSNGSTNIALDGNWIWTPTNGSSSVTYDLEVSENADYSLPIIQTNVTAFISPGADNQISEAYLYLKPNTQYYWRVRYHLYATQSGWNDYSSDWTTASFQTISSICSAPDNFAVFINDDNTVALSWDAISGAEGYSIEYKLSADAQWSYTSTTSNQIVLDGLTENADYDVRVRALRCDAYTTTEQFNINSCIAPTDIQLTDSDDQSLTIGWTQVNGGTNYLLQYKENGTVDWTTINVSGSAYQITGLTPYTDYDVRLAESTCKRLGPESVFTTMQECLQPQSPAHFEESKSSVTLAWQPIPGALEYTLEYKLVSDASWTTITTANANYLATGLSGNVSYEFRVTMSGCGLYSTTEQFEIIICDVPDNLSATNITTNSASLSWSEANAGTDYTINYRLTSASSWIEQSTTGTNADLMALEEGSIYEYKVRENSCADFSSIAQFTTKFCETITNFNVNEISSSSVSIIWFSSQSNIDYTFEYKSSGASSWTSSTTSNPTITLSGLAGGIYHYRVKLSECDNYSEEQSFSVGSVTGIQNPETINFSVYPSPANNSISIEHERNSFSLVTVYHVNGAKVLSKEIGQSKKKINLDISSLQNGIYILVAHSDGMLYSKKFEIRK